MAKGITPSFGSLAFVRWSPIQRKMEICFLGKRIERLGLDAAPSRERIFRGGASPLPFPPL